MEEKKLTDEEIVKAILQSIEYSKTITYFDEWGNCKAIWITDILDLIHRLQSENAEQKAENERLSFYKTVFDKGLAVSLVNMQETIDKQKAEIEQLTLAVEGLKGENKVIHKENDELLGKIERLTEENKNLSIKVWNYERPARTSLYSSESMINCNLVTCYNENADLKSKNAELQKQVYDWVRVHDEQLSAMQVLTIENKNLQKDVDELKEDLERLDAVQSLNEILMLDIDKLKEERDVFKKLFEHCNNSSITIDQIIESMNSFYREQAEHLAELKIEQAVKDTAKECYELFKFYKKHYYDIPLDLVARDIKEKTGVEVE